MTSRPRADRLLVSRGLFESRTLAQAAINAGLVAADGILVRKASQEISANAALVAARPHPYVSRGGIKLAAALDHYRVDVTGRVCLDVGASTGGFSEVLLLRGAKRVYAVDVGHGQLHASLRGHCEIVSLEKTDIRSLEPSRLVEPPDLATVDVSFISLKLVLPAIAELLQSTATIIALIKPQYEVARREAKKGIVRSESARASACQEIAASFRSQGWLVRDAIPSPILGGDGNVEYLIEAERG
ncbi:MAG TPA: TlyA family RNA methyltransferase [Xanthobacteraceae bacterium]|jgi:23S rRNA (cytidine1920-2'-O)/16S rRNA (cytidine1409-2'-O)-methyltransferase|nr:TlyA family RNA methyltransferase [Xanthobacteraceae bacterium]